MHIVSRQQLITQSNYKNTSYYRYMQALEHEVFHRVFHRQGANRSHKYPSAEFKFSGMFYNIVLVSFFSENSEDSEYSEFSDYSDHSEYSEHHSSGIRPATACVRGTSVP